MQTRDMTYELLKASKMSAERSNKKMLVFLIEMALLEAELSVSANPDTKRRHPAHIPQIPRSATTRMRPGTTAV
ncbi:hypothetical protein OIU34_14300 [Pararhizobium sp. BT-229]|uniref:hypothetical protein n=1 Tax=Pararhizobium sp. BT-229 TaxID=2986923 RepID=UPI0021F6E977|nr:hypothetical protein [Pararhizobium sp. BT-229]MCV9963077.1 hypothetical protein [Pararhizobium sp. BT-229]